MKPLPDWVHDVVWLNDENAVTFTTSEDEPGPTGAMWWHRDQRTPDEWHMGGFQWKTEHPPYGDTVYWDLLSLDPLSVTPSLHCLTCGAHGFITDGKWRPA